MGEPMGLDAVEEVPHPDWVRRLDLLGEAAGGPQHVVPLDSAELLSVARSTTGLDDVGEVDWPGWEETYHRFMTSVDEEIDLTLLGRLATRAEALRILRTWLGLQEHWTVTPAVMSEPVEAPLFVVGPPRTGTTILLELLALDPQLRAPLAREALHPLPGPVPGGDVERRVELSEPEQELWIDIDPRLIVMHELRSDLPCECIHFLSYDFGSPYWVMFYDTSSFQGWSLEHIDQLVPRMYRLHRRFLQTLQHGEERRRWLLKSPSHLATLPGLFAEYPDARVVCTHRDPRRFIASLVGVLPVMRRMRSEAVDLAKVAPSMLATYQLMLEQIIEQRQAGLVPDEQIVDTHFLDLMDDPVRSLRRIYDRFGLDWPAGHDQAVRGYLSAKPRDKVAVHHDGLGQLGLGDDTVRASFAGYVDHYRIGEE